MPAEEHIQSSTTEFHSTLIKATRRRTFGYRPAVDRSSHRPSLCSSKQPCLERGLWSLERDRAALMRHSSPVRALHCTHAHGTGSSPVFPARLPASCRSTVAVGAPRRSRGCTWGSRIHIRIHSRAGQPGGWRAAACAVALHWQMEMEIALDQSPSLSRAAGMGNPEPAARAVFFFEGSGGGTPTAHFIRKRKVKIRTWYFYNQ
jgi:pimeloyl-ACP methyl ester carboxylesterase